MLNWLRSLFGAVIITDGDTINYKGESVRLAYIDAPELDQPGGKEAKKHLGWLLKQAGRLEVKIIGRCKYGRKLGVLIAQGVEDEPVNRKLVQDGYAIPFGSTKYAADAAIAKKKKLNWVGMRGFVTPAAWRKRKK